MALEDFELQEPEPRAADALQAVEFDADDDLFNFDEHAASGAGAERGDPQAEAIDRDLSVLDELGESAGSGPSDPPPALPKVSPSAGPSDPVPSVPDGAAREPTASEPPPPLPSRVPSTPSSAGATMAPGPEAAAPAGASGSVQEWPVPATPTRAAAPLAGPRLLAAIVAITLVNVALVAIALRSQRTVERSLEDVGTRVARSVADLEARTAESVSQLVDWRRPAVRTAPEGYEALEVAETELRERRFARARLRLYSLLAVADRIDEQAREDIEARASFLIAESWRLEADERAGTSTGGPG